MQVQTLEQTLLNFLIFCKSRFPLFIKKFYKINHRFVVNGTSFSITSIPHLIQVSDEDADDRDDEDEAVAADGVVVGAVPLGKEVKAGVDLVLAHGLEDPGRANQGGDGRGQGCCKASCVDQRSPG